MLSARSLLRLYGALQAGLGDRVVRVSVRREYSQTMSVSAFSVYDKKEPPLGGDSGVRDRLFPADGLAEFLIVPDACEFGPREKEGDQIPVIVGAGFPQ